ncbi:winged helix-turn-helix domain-containing protein [Sphingomicrobium astaxanthinifaciens]|uniref:winged helix-turn-helix domain-containing protein n=1 Tax=Sphingomicrobium astaxanthinifaciens TaxID=1227949 RepID=UPI001FCB12AC|nr:winged helix-turn-helix domain-containing protein [Sphingomicrobium astaxanthinifaciens]MCJ7420245.1 winged helix-turn-helix domain-containing protein [Sphingomicrobium astaxanthinifaciens]
MTAGPRPTIAIGEYRIDPGDERVTGPSGPVKLGNKAFRVLCALAEREGRLLTKDALFETVWDGMAVSESALTTTIRELRRALGDDPRHPRYIESVYGRGYRLVADVRHEAAAREDMAVVRDGAPAPPPVPARTQTRADAEVKGLEAGRPPRIAVGDFSDEAVAKRHPYIGASMREEVLLGLSRFREIQAVDAKHMDPGPARRRDYRLDVNFLPAPQGSKANVRLQRAQDGGIVWAEMMLIEDEGVGAGVEAIVRQIVAAVLPALDQDISIGIGGTTGTLFDRYLAAKRLSVEAQDRATAEDAARKLEAIVAEKPDFALAYPPLVRLYNIDYGYNALGASGPVERKRALELAKAGLAADRSHVHAYTVLGFCHLYHAEFDQALSCFEHALKRNPFNPDRLNEVATGLTYLGDFERARALFEQSDGIQPFADDNSQEDLGRLALLEGDMDGARKYFARVTMASLWSQLCSAVTAWDKDAKRGRKAVARWKTRVHEGWHRPIPPSDEEIVAWFRFHHPFRDDAGKPYVELVTAALTDA